MRKDRLPGAASQKGEREGGAQGGDRGEIEMLEDGQARGVMETEDRFSRRMVGQLCQIRQSIPER